MRSRTDVHDEQIAGRPSVISDALLERMEEAIRANRRLKLKELPQIIPEVSMTTFYEVLTVKLGFKKLFACWVPKMLTEEHKRKRMYFALDFLTCYVEAGDEFLDHIVTGDETWVYPQTPESKQESMQWRHSNSPKAKICKTSISANKNHGFCFWDRQDILLL
ncbi:histone-lysine N-methyltransferase SETMAR [Trichonephila clavipes]|nr:histone-lysine N-methyltransferase SETMAR [Trichonephila clavipes]